MPAQSVLSLFRCRQTLRQLRNNQSLEIRKWHSILRNGRVRRWRLRQVGLLVVVGYFVATSQRVTGMFSTKALASSEAGHAASHGPATAEPAHAGHGHGGDQPTIKTTLWAEKIDIFLERPYAVAGKAIEPLFHVTIIKDGSPVTEGSFIFKATGPEQVEVRMEKPTRTGIFIPSVTFPKPGTYQAKMIVESQQVAGGGETIELPPVVVYANNG